MRLPVETVAAALTILVCFVSSAPTKSPPSAAIQRQQKLANIKKLEKSIVQSASSGHLRDAVRMEQTMENEIMATALSEVLQSPAGFRDWKLLQEMLRRDTHVVNVISDRLTRSTRKEQEGVQDQMKRGKRAVELLSGILGASSGGGGRSNGDGNTDGDGGSSGAGLISSVLGASSGKTNRAKREIPVNDKERKESTGENYEIQRLVATNHKGENLTFTNRTVMGNTTKRRIGNLFDGPGLAELWGLSPPAPHSHPVPGDFNPPEGFPPFIADQGIADVIDISNDINGEDIDSYFDMPKNLMMKSELMDDNNNMRGDKHVREAPLHGKIVTDGVLNGLVTFPDAQKNSAIKQGIIGGAQIENTPGLVSSSAPSASPGLLGGINQGGGVPSGLIGGQTIININVPGNTKVTGPGGVFQPNGDNIGLIGGIDIVNSRPTVAPTSSTGGSGSGGGVEVFGLPNPPTVLHPPNAGGNDGGFGFMGENPTDGNSFGESGGARPVKQTNGGGGYQYPKPTDSYDYPKPNPGYDYPKPTSGYGVPDKYPPTQDQGSDSFGALTGLLMGLLAPFSMAASGSSSGGHGTQSGGGSTGGGGSDIFSAVAGLLGPLSSSSSGGGSNVLGSIAGLSGPLSGSSSGGGGDDDDDAGGSDSFGALAGLSGPLSSSSSGGGGGNSDGGGSNVGGLISSALGASSGGSSGGGGRSTVDLTGGDPISDDDESEDELAGTSGGSNPIGLFVGVLGSLSGGGDPDGGGGSNVLSLVTSLAGASSSSSSTTGDGNSDASNSGAGSANFLSSFLGASSGGSDGNVDDGRNSESSGGSGSASIITSVLGASSGGSSGGGGGDGSDSDSSGGSGSASIITSVLGSSSGGSSGGGGGDGRDSDSSGGSGSASILSSVLGASSGGGGGGGEDGESSGGSGSASILSSLLGASSGGGGGGDDDRSGGGSGGILSSLLGASSGGGDGRGTDGGGSLLGASGSSSGGGEGGGGSSNFGGQLLSMLFRIKFAIFRTLLSLVTGFLGASSSQTG